MGTRWGRGGSRGNLPRSRETAGSASLTPGPPGLSRAPLAAPGRTLGPEQVRKPQPPPPSAFPPSGPLDLNRTAWARGPHADGKIHTWLEKELYLCVLNSHSSRRINR